MGKFNKALKTLFSPAKETKSFGGSGFYRGTYSLGNIGLTSYGNDPYRLIYNAYMGNPNVYSVISLISKSASVIQWKVFEVTEEKSFRQINRCKYNSKLYDFAKHQINKHQSMEEVGIDNDLQQLLDRPNPTQGMSEYMENLIGFKLVTGNGISHGVRLNDGTVSEMWNLPPQFMKVIGRRSVESMPERYILTNFGQGPIVLPADDILHLKYWNPDFSSEDSHLWGLSPLSSAGRVISRNNQSHIASENAFKNQGAQGILYPELGPNEESPFDTEEEFAAWAQQFDREGKGAEQHKNIIVSASKMGWMNLGLSPVDLQLLESQQMDLRQIAQVYGVSTELLNDPANKTQSNKMEAKKALYTEVILPMIDNVRDELNNFLVPGFEARDGKRYYIDYDITSIHALQDDLDKQTDRLMKSFWVTPNERRLFQNLDTSENAAMDLYYIPSNLVPIDFYNDPMSGEFGDEQED